MLNQRIKCSYVAKSNNFILWVPFNLTGYVRGLPSRRFSEREKTWTVPGIYRNITALADMPKDVIEFNDLAMDAITRKRTEMRGKRLDTIGFPTWYAFKTKPRPKQLEALNVVYDKKSAALFMDMRTGKSKTVIDLACAYIMEKKVEIVLIVCPISIKTNWIDQIEGHSPILFNYHLLDTAKRKKFELWLEDKSNTNPKVLIVGVESLAAGSATEYCKRFMHTSKKSLMVVDESSKIKNHKATRTENCTMLGLMAEYRVILTGSPIANGPIDLYAQFEFLDPDIIGMGDFYSFRNRYCVMGGYENKQIIGYDNMEELMELIKPYTYMVTQSEVFDKLPEKVYAIRVVSLSKEQKKHYDTMKETKTVEDNGKELTVQNALEKMLRLQEITGGHVSFKSEDLNNKEKFDRIRIDGPNPKLIELMNCIDETIGSVIIWAQFRDEIKMIVEELGMMYGKDSVVEFHGGVSEEDRKINRDAFQNKNARFFVGNTATGGMGLELSAANTMIYFSNSFNFIDRMQSVERAFEATKDSILVVDIVAERTVDVHIAKALQLKQDMSDYVRSALSKDEELF